VAAIRLRAGQGPLADYSGRRTVGRAGRVGWRTRAGGRLGPADDSGRRTTRAGGRLGPADDSGLYRRGQAIPADDSGRRAGPAVGGGGERERREGFLWLLISHCFSPLLALKDTEWAAGS
jgi:hypothetical protein